MNKKKTVNTIAATKNKKQKAVLCVARTVYNKRNFAHGLQSNDMLWFVYIYCIIPFLFCNNGCLFRINVETRQFLVISFVVVVDSNWIVCLSLSIFPFCPAHFLGSQYVTKRTKCLLMYALHLPRTHGSRFGVSGGKN